MKIKKLNPDVIMPTKGTRYAGAFDIYMPEAGKITGAHTIYGLGFAAEIPENHVALILPRSGVGSKFGVELNNTCGVIDADYRGEWKVSIRTKSNQPFCWEKGDRLFQFLVVPVANVTLEEVDDLPESKRGTGGFGSTGQ